MPERSDHRIAPFLVFVVISIFLFAENRRRTPLFSFLRLSKGIFGEIMKGENMVVRKRAILILALLLVLCFGVEQVQAAAGPVWGKDVTDRKLNSRNGTPYGIGRGELVCTTYCGWAVHKYYGIKRYPAGGFVRTHNAWMAAHARKVCNIRSPSEYARKQKKIQAGDIVCFNTGRNFRGVWMHIAIVGGDRRTLHHAVNSGVSYRYTLYGWLSYLDQAKSCKIYRLTKEEGVNGDPIHDYPPEKIRGKKVHVRYLRSGDSRLNVRSLVVQKAFRKYRTTQGACSDGRYLYMSFVKKGARFQFARIIKFDMEGRHILRVSRRLPLGHANDMTYLPDRKQILVTHSSVGTRKRLFIHIISPETLECIGKVRIRLPRKVSGATGKQLRSIRAFSSIAFDPYTDRIYLKVRNQRAYLRLDRDYRVRSYFRTEKKYRQLTTQTITFDEKHLVRAQSRGQSNSDNVISFFTRKGRYVKSIRPILKGELEGLFYHGDRLYATIHRKRMVNGRLIVRTNIVEIKM